MVEESVLGLQGGRPRKVLVVDDNPSTLKLMATLFAEEGLAVALAGSVAEAKERLQGSERFDLVLSDIQMPRETGFDLLQWIKEKDSPFINLPVLLTTAELPEIEYRLKGLSLGAVDYVVRPVDLKELVIRSLHAMEHVERIRRLEHTLEQSESLALTGQLLAAGNHEVKNLAMIISGTAERVEKIFQGSAGPLGDSALKSLQQSTSLLVDIVRQMQFLQNESPSHIETINLVELLRDIVTLMGDRVAPCLLEIDVSQAPDGFAWVEGRVTGIKQILINLILNGNEAIREKAPIEGGAISVILVSDQGGWSIKVRDNGIGLPEAGVLTQFKAFNTTRKLRGGQGLGLWLCQKLAHLMGGQLSLSSEGVGKGATATLKLGGTSPKESLNLADYFVN